MDTQAFLEQFHKIDAFSRALGIRVRTLRPGLVEAEMDAGADKQNYMGHLHGGAYFSLCDVAAGLCASANGEQCVTLDASIHYLRRGHGSGRSWAAPHPFAAGGESACAACRYPPKTAPCSPPAPSPCT